MYEPKVGDKVVSNTAKHDWPFGILQGYDKKPGTVFKVDGDVFLVRWPDGHETIHIDRDEEVVPPLDKERLKG